MVGQEAWIAVYIVASARNGTLYVGVTSALPNRIQQHKLGTLDGFTRKYGCKTLVWYENHATMPEAIAREKQIKRWRRAWKLALVERENVEWRDLSDGWFDVPEGPLSWTQRP
ncbi:MAG TPA: GIY-YIG nuclease family protein [Caulobacteraceae bacterium]|jgi:putative endonuclease